MRIAVFADVHANLPALEAALEAIRTQGCEAIWFAGDAIAIGPYPAECLDRLLSTPGLECVKGNHDAWLVDGLPQPRPEWMSEGEVEHQRWTHARIDTPARAAVVRWPYLIQREFEGIRVAVVHYGVEHCQAPYDDRDLARAFEERAVPERAFLDQAFFGRRFGVQISD